jgi:hypothetical protein
VEEDGELGMGPTSAKEDRPVNMILSGGDEDGDIGFGRFAFSRGKGKKNGDFFLLPCFIWGLYNWTRLGIGDSWS